MLHALICKAGAKWSVFVREHETLAWSVVDTNNVLRTTVEASFPYGFTNPWTFSERQFEEVAANVAEEPEQLAGVDRAVDLDILAPERRFPTDDRWARVTKSHGRTELWTTGGTFRGFRQGGIFNAVLTATVLELLRLRPHRPILAHVYAASSWCGSPALRTGAVHPIDVECPPTGSPELQRIPGWSCREPGNDRQAAFEVADSQGSDPPGETGSEPTKVSGRSRGKAR